MHNFLIKNTDIFSSTFDILKTVWKIAIVIRFYSKRKTRLKLITIEWFYWNRRKSCKKLLIVWINWAGHFQFKSNLLEFSKFGAKAFSINKFSLNRKTGNDWRESLGENYLKTKVCFINFAKLLFIVFYWNE